MQRNLIIAAGAIVILGVGVALYFTFFNKGPSLTVTQPSLPAAGNASSTTPVVTPHPTATTQTTTVARLAKISDGPIVPGEVVTDTKATASSTTEVAVGYIERESGNIYSYSPRTGSSVRTSNKTVPGIQSATWLPDGSLAFVRYLTGTDYSIVNTYALSATGASGFFLPQNLSDIDVSTSSVLTLASGVNGSIVSLVRTDGSRSSAIFASPLSEIHTSFAGKNQYLVYTKPTATLTGAAFLVNSKGIFSHIVGPLNGLTAKASPSGKWVLISYTNNGELMTGLVGASTGEYIPLPVATITDKCVWTADDSAIYCGVPVDPSTENNYPDDWYQGAISFSDRIWKIQVAGRYAQFVLDFTKDIKTPLDLVAPAIDPLASTLVFINKNDGSLWKYSL
jgi:hypothetical protein